MTKVIVVRPFDENVPTEDEWMPVGSTFDGKLLIKKDGSEHWRGTWASRAGSYEIEVPAEYCEVWSEEKHDPVYRVKRLEALRLESAEQRERAELARLKVKYNET
jgi:hypothetical protein